MTLLCEVFVKKPRGNIGIFARELITLGFVHTDRLIDQMWARDTEGGPLGVSDILKTYTYRLRGNLRPGWRIEVEYDRGYHLFAPQAVADERVAA